MRTEFVEESRSRVSWKSRSPLIYAEVGLLLLAVAFAGVAMLTHSAARWAVMVAVVGVCVLVGLLLAVTVPLVDQGFVERLPEGGRVERARTWLLRGVRPLLATDLDGLVAFEVETEAFEDAPPATYEQARLWVVSEGGERHPLTGWAEPSSVIALGEALGKTARRPFEVRSGNVV